MVRPEDAESGLTHGIPLEDHSKVPEYDLVPHPIDPRFPDEKWFSVRVAPEHLQELIRTPRYNTWQGERWLFCCQRPSAFLGSVPTELVFKGQPPSLGAISEWLEAPNWEATASNKYGSHTCYLFRCVKCGRIQYHDDCD